MLFFNFELNKNEPVYIQIKNYIEDLKTEGLVYSIKGQGTFVKEQSSVRTSSWNVDWSLYENEYTKNVNKMDSSKN